ncbi:MAG: flagellin [Alphaproteobacteria bacterium]|nr:flagellin [Alphaproteobacteria bacterium]
MGSLLTNTSSMIALSTLRGINQSLADVQQQISTGKRVANARDNAAVYAITSVMNSDVKGFEAITSSLSLGSSSVAVARGAAEQVNELLQEIKGSIVAAQEDNVDRSKIQEDVSRLRDQIKSIVGSAQFNGQNLLRGFDAIDILASLDRDANQNVSASDISVNRFDLTTTAATWNAAVGSDIAAEAVSGPATGTLNDTSRNAVFTVGTAENTTDYTIEINGTDYTYTSDASVDADEIIAGLRAEVEGAGIEGITVSIDAGADTITIENNSAFTDFQIRGKTSSATKANFTFNVDGGGATNADEAVQTLEQRAEEINITSRSVQSGEGYRFTVNGYEVLYVAKSGDNVNDVAAGLKAEIDRLSQAQSGLADVTVNIVNSGDPLTVDAVLQIDNNSSSDVTLANVAARDGQGSSGGLRALDSINVSTSSGAQRALENIEGLIQTSVDAAATFGSAQRRIDIQSDFIKDLTDSLKSGIGALVDADLEAASAQLQSLQVQQQLGIQALSIANQNPQTLLSLFR